MRITRLATALIITFLAISSGITINCGDDKSAGGKQQKGSKVALDKIDRYNIGAGRNVKTLYTEGPFIYVGTSEGIVRFNMVDGTHKVYDNTNSGLLSKGIFYMDKYGDELWVGTYGGGLSIYNGKDWRNYNIPHGMGDPFVYGFDVAPNGDVWIATWSGANQIIGGKLDDPKAWRTYTVENTNGGLPNDWVYAIIAAPDGKIWMGTEGGLALYDNGKWQNWAHKDGLGAPYEKVKGNLVKIDRDPHQHSQHHSIQRTEQGLDHIKDPYNPNYIIAMQLDEKGRIWCGTWGGGLALFENGKFRNFTTDDGLLGNYVTMLKIAPDGTLWIGQNKGISYLEEGMFGNTFHNYTTRDGIFSNVVFSMAFAEDGSDWVGSIGGVVRFKGGLK